MKCGKRISAEPEANEATHTEEPISDEPKTEIAPTTKRSTFERVKKAFDLSGGICLMTAVLFALVFTLCMGLSAHATIRYSGISSSISEKTMLWEYFGSAYEDLADSLNAMESYSGYYEAANYIPVVLSTVVSAGTIICVLVFTILSATNYGKHFKNPELDYAKHAVAAVLSFVLGATAFLAINSTSASLDTRINISVSFSPETLAGIILCGIFVSVYFAFKAVALGKSFLGKKTIVNFVCTLVGILFAILTAAFAKSPAIIIDGTGSDASSSMLISFSNINMLISSAFSTDSTGAMPDNFDATYICSALAQFAQLAVLVLAFVVHINRIGIFGNKEKSHLGTSIALFALSVVYLVLSCLTLHFGTELVTGVEEIEPVIAAAPIVTVVMAAFAFADSVVHTVLARKFEMQN